MAKYFVMYARDIIIILSQQCEHVTIFTILTDYYQNKYIYKYVVNL